MGSDVSKQLVVGVREVVYGFIVTVLVGFIWAIGHPVFALLFLLIMVFVAALRLRTGEARGK